MSDQSGIDLTTVWQEGRLWRASLFYLKTFPGVDTAKAQAKEIEAVLQAAGADPIVSQDQAAPRPCLVVRFGMPATFTGDSEDLWRILRDPWVDLGGAHVSVVHVPHDPTQGITPAF